MTRLDWGRAKPLERRSQDVGAMTDKRRQFIAARLAQLKRDSLKRASHTRPGGPPPPPEGS